MAVAEGGDARISQVDYLVEIEGNHDCFVFSDTVKYDSPVSPIKGCIQVSFIEVISVQLAAIVDPESVSLPDFTLNADFPDSVFHFSVCITCPIAVVLLASSNPMALSIQKITQRNKVNLSKPREIVTAIRTVVKFDA